MYQSLWYSKMFYLLISIYLLAISYTCIIIPINIKNIIFLHAYKALFCLFVVLNHWWLISNQEQNHSCFDLCDLTNKQTNPQKLIFIPNTNSQYWDIAVPNRYHIILFWTSIFFKPWNFQTNQIYSIWLIFSTHWSYSKELTK